MWNKEQDSYKKYSLIATILMVVCISIFSAIYVIVIYGYTYDQSFMKLKSATEETIDSIEGEFRADRNMLRIIANIISSSDDSLHALSVNTYLNMYDVNSLISDIAILTSDNKVIRISGMDLDSEGVLNFDEIKTRGEHISTLLKDLEKEGVYDLRSFVPIRRNDETIAFLYGTTTPEDILNAWVPEIYDGHATVSVIERSSGIFLIDGAGRMNKNLADVDINVTSISVDDTLKNAILSGRRGYAIGKDNETGITKYYCFLPMRLADWEMVVSVSEEDVFAQVKPMRVYLYAYLLVVIATLVGYLLFLLKITHGSLVGIERRANMDALTGLQNRNRYEYFCQHLQQGTDGLACIYFDVNGLHEVNNTMGHIAGDAMLKTVARIISEEFGEANTYRIGGDEFVAFRYEREEENVRKDLRKVEKEIEEKGYHVASGLAMATPDKKLAVVIKTAEEEMYDNKRKYYESIGKEMRG
ncbi:sensor domain-containing diguanylate cyclase [Butyrivibrio sp. LC3010]|uniref:sensor domain-containing diguanylate cyclase n=1 Tax=Butyrivibrio sp. LC3010 TaxID=1280680 RepID=UPI0004084974|nr:sensor domain-containing diguanylate cyclase [Butyrivibrio sp. LC3010]